MPSLEDIRLGQLSVARGLCLPLEVEECLTLQHKSEQTGQTDRLGELLIARGYLTRTQLTRLLSTQRDAEQKVTRIGPYELIRKLGEGGMGAVYQARDTRNDKIVALKVLPRSRAKDKIFLQRFEQEARAAFELDHPNIIHGLDVGNADGYYFLVMEYVQGYDVYTLLEQKGRLAEKEALQILEQIAAALDHIHGERLVHRDIKPENIIVSEEGVAKLADMGLTIDSETQGRRRITQAGIAMGTPFYLSPEQIEGKSEADIRSDIYALGTTVYEMVTGRPPFEGETPAVVMMKHLNEQVPSPHEIDHTISLHFCHLLEKMMAKNPADRYQTPAELLTDIQRVKQAQVPLGTRPPSGKSSVCRPQDHKPRAAMQSPLTENLERLEPLLSSPSGKEDSRVTSAVRGRKAPAGGSASRIRNNSADSDPTVKYAVIVGVIVSLLAVLTFLIFSVFRTQ
jgi:eukaryotic-like serine/threonine-protein kinase